jgi:hypothetical protein
MLMYMLEEYFGFSPSNGQSMRMMLTMALEARISSDQNFDWENMNLLITLLKENQAQLTYEKMQQIAALIKIRFKF